MLSAKPTHWWSQDYRISDGQTPIATLTVGKLRERETFSVQGKQYKVIKEGFFSPTFYLKENEKTVIEASRSGVFSRSFTWTLNGMPYTLGSAAWYSNNFNVFRSETRIGSIRRRHWYSGVDLPQNVPLEIQIFALWLVVLQWKQNSGSS